MEIHDNPQPGESVPKPRLELGTSRTEASKVIALSNLLVKSTVGQPTALAI